MMIYRLSYYDLLSACGLKVLQSESDDDVPARECNGHRALQHRVEATLYLLLYVRNSITIMSIC